MLTFVIQTDTVRLVQLVEHQIVVLGVVGSSPTSHPKWARERFFESLSIFIIYAPCLEARALGGDAGSLVEIADLALPGLGSRSEGPAQPDHNALVVKLLFHRADDF